MTQNPYSVMETELCSENTKWFQQGWPISEQQTLPFSIMFHATTIMALAIHPCKLWFSSIELNSTDNLGLVYVKIPEHK